MKKSQIYSLICTIVSGILIVLLLLFLYMPFHNEEQEEGIMVSFGDAIEGFGETPNPESMQQSLPVPPPIPVKEEMMTQEEEETVALEAKKKKERQEQLQQEQLIAKQKQQEEKERKRIEAEQLAEKKRIEAEQAAKAAKAGKAGSVFGQQIGVGESSGTGTAGNPAGKGSAGGNSWSLNGRDLKSDFFRPVYTSDEEGKIIVSIRVNENGDVTSTTIAAGTTITDTELRKSAMDAARKTKFSSGESIAIGTITYNFKLK